MKLLLSVFLLLFFFSSCRKKERAPFIQNSKAPGMLDNITVENLPGAAKITYSFSDNPNILYVMAKYETKGGRERVEKSSVYKNSMLLEGFTSTEQRDISLYLVNRSENKSNPVEVSIKPLRAPIIDASNSIAVKAAFGGVFIQFDNQAEDQYVLNTMVKDSTGEWEVYDRYYTSKKEIDYSVHGLDSVSADFGFFLIDQWQNHSDTLFETITPLYEEQLDKSLWENMKLDNDSYIPYWDGRPLSNIWDGTNTSAFMAKKEDVYGGKLPNWFTIDLGVSTKLSRIRMYGYAPTTADPAKWLFTRGTPSKFKLWGSLQKPDQDGSWDEWTLLGEFEPKKPSGSPVSGAITDEDLALGMKGHDFSIPFTDMPYRYIRFETIETFGGTYNVLLGEITLWGQPQ